MYVFESNYFPLTRILAGTRTRSVIIADHTLIRYPRQGIELLLQPAVTRVILQLCISLRLSNEYENDEWIFPGELVL